MQNKINTKHVIQVIKNNNNKNSIKWKKLYAKANQNQIIEKTNKQKSNLQRKSNFTKTDNEKITVPYPRFEFGMFQVNQTENSPVETLDNLKKAAHTGNQTFAQIQQKRRLKITSFTLRILYVSYIDLRYVVLVYIMARRL